MVYLRLLLKIPHLDKSILYTVITVRKVWRRTYETIAL